MTVYNDPPNNDPNPPSRPSPDQPTQPINQPYGLPPQSDAQQPYGQQSYGQPPQQPYGMPPQQPYGQPQPPKRNNRLWWWIGGCGGAGCLGVIALVIGLYFIGQNALRQIESGIATASFEPFSIDPLPSVEPFALPSDDSGTDDLFSPEASDTSDDLFSPEASDAGDDAPLTIGDTYEYSSGLFTIDTLGWEPGEEQLAEGVVVAFEDGSGSGDGMVVVVTPEQGLSELDPTNLLPLLLRESFSPENGFNDLEVGETRTGPDGRTWIDFTYTQGGEPFKGQALIDFQGDKAGFVMGGIRESQVPTQDTAFTDAMSSFTLDPDVPLQ